MRIAVLALVLLAGCRPKLATAADACWMWAETLCDKAKECADPGGDNPGACRAAFVDGCCSSGRCAEPLDEAQVEVALDCDYWFGQLSCGQFSAGLLPKGCGG